MADVIFSMSLITQESVYVIHANPVLSVQLCVCVVQESGLCADFCPSGTVVAVGLNTGR